MILRPCGVSIRENRLLTMRYHYADQDRFNLPGGGVEDNEQAVEALQREYREELGVGIIPGDLLFCCETVIHGRHVLHLAFVIQELLGIPHCNHAATSALEAVWVPLENLGRETLYPAIGPELQSVYLHGLSRTVYLGRVEQSWYE
ncbi:MAG: NUDIX domain-containing protein [Magnetococcales bacterium]|nr:NUDIX domain-containing protein [Magnetococcales bacterium]